MPRWLLCLACVSPMAAAPLGAAQPAPSSTCDGRCLTLQGAKDTEHGLGFSVAYTTTAKADACVTHNRLAGVTTQKTRYEFLPPVRKGETYRIDIPLDAHVGGPCGWQVAGVFLDVMSTSSLRLPPKPGHSLFLFGDTPGTLPRLDLQCLRTAYKGAFGNEQASYLCQTAGQTRIPTLGPGAHTIELNFGSRQ